jgi:hypothetical protein
MFLYVQLACICVYIHTYIHMHTYICVYTYIHTYIHHDTYIHTCDNHQRIDAVYAVYAVYAFYGLAGLFPKNFLTTVNSVYTRINIRACADNRGLVTVLRHCESMNL